MVAIFALNNRAAAAGPASSAGWIGTFTSLASCGPGARREADDRTFTASNDDALPWVRTRGTIVKDGRKCRISVRGGERLVLLEIYLQLTCDQDVSLCVLVGISLPVRSITMERPNANSGKDWSDTDLTDLQQCIKIGMSETNTQVFSAARPKRSGREQRNWWGFRSVHPKTTICEPTLRARGVLPGTVGGLTGSSATIRPRDWALAALADIPLTFAR